MNQVMKKQKVNKLYNFLFDKVQKNKKTNHLKNHQQKKMKKMNTMLIVDLIRLQNIVISMMICPVIIIKIIR